MMDNRLINRCLKGDRLAQKTLYDAYKVKMFMICLRYARDRHEAEDILQDGYMKIFKDLHQYRGHGSLEGWMSKVMIRAALGYLRKRKGKHVCLEDDAFLSLSHEQNLTYARLGAKEITQMIQLLPTGYKTVFNLFVIDGYSHKEIAKMLDISENTSKTQLFKAKKKLKQMLEAPIYI